jgi:hypothetical protein
MSIEQDLQALHNHEHFARFMQVIHNLREEAIAELHEARTENIQQVSGRIITYDQILQFAGWEKLRKRFSDSL